MKLLVLIEKKVCTYLFIDDIKREDAETVEPLFPSSRAHRVKSAAEMYSTDYLCTVQFTCVQCRVPVYSTGDNRVQSVPCDGGEDSTHRVRHI